MNEEVRQTQEQQSEVQQEQTQKSERVSIRQILEKLRNVEMYIDAFMNDNSSQFTMFFDTVTAALKDHNERLLNVERQVTEIKQMLNDFLENAVNDVKTIVENITEDFKVITDDIKDGIDTIMFSLDGIVEKIDKIKKTKTRKRKKR